MDYISQQDLDVRMQLTGCKFGQLTNEFADNLKYGRKCIVENQRNLVLLNAYLELLECYKVASGTIYKNCITEEQLALMLDKISKLINICFQPYDFTYTDLHT
jgi:hypothetical protein